MPTRARTCPPAGPPRGRPAGWGYVKRVPSYPPAAAAFASPGAGAQEACGCTGPSCCWQHCWPWSRHSSVSGAVGGSSGTRGARGVVLAVSCPWAPWGSRGFPVGPHTGTGWGGVGIGPPGAELAPGWAVGWVWAPPAPGSAHPLAWGVRSTRRDQRLHCFVQMGTPRGPHPSVHRRCHGDPVGTACRSQWGREGTRGERSPHPAPRCSSAERHMKELWAAPCDGLCPTPQPEPITWPWGCAGGLSAVPSHPRPLSRRRRWPEPRWR